MDIDNMQENIIEVGKRIKQNDKAYTYIMQKLNDGVDIEILNDIREVLIRDIKHQEYNLVKLGSLIKKLPFSSEDLLKLVKILQEVQKEYNKR